MIDASKHATAMSECLLIQHLAMVYRLLCSVGLVPHHLDPEPGRVLFRVLQAA